MKEHMYRIWWTCWIFGAILTMLSFWISTYPNHSYFHIIGVFFLIIHLVGLINVASYISGINPVNR